MQCFVGTQKNHLNETLVFVYSNAYVFIRLGRSVRLEENNNFLIQFYLQPNSFELKLLKDRCEMSETRVHFELKRVNI